MKTVKLFFKFFLFLNLAVGATAAHAQLTAQHFLHAFDQLESLSQQKGTNAQALRMAVYNEFNMAKDLRPEEFNTVVFELLLKYSQNPKIRVEIQTILTELSKNVDADIFNARQRFETPIVIARALTWGFTIVIAARSVRTLLHMATAKDALTPQIAVPKNPIAAIEGTKQVTKLSLSARMNSIYQTFTQRCYNSTMCSNWSAGIITGGVIEGIQYYLDSLDTAKVHPLEALRLVQAHLACELHWNIYDFGKKWDQEPDWKKARTQLYSYAEQADQFQKSYSALEDVYRKDLAIFLKNYPNSESWWKLASSIVDPKGRTCQQISTSAMIVDMQQIGSTLNQKHQTEIKAEQEEELKKLQDALDKEKEKKEATLESNENKDKTKVDSKEDDEEDEDKTEEMKAPESIPDFKGEDL